MTTRKRKQLVIEPKIQYALIRQLLAQWGLHLLVTLVLLTMLQVLLGGVFRPWPYHLQRIWPMLGTLAVSLLFLLPIFIQSSLKLSNRFVGPIHRLRRELRQMADGHPYDGMKFRETDYWSELAHEFDNAVESLQKQVQTQQSASQPTSTNAAPSDNVPCEPESPST